MVTDWDETDDLEKLIEFDDVDSVYGLDTGNKQQSSNVPYVSASSDDAAIPNNTPKATGSGNPSEPRAHQPSQTREDREIVDVDPESGRTPHRSQNTGGSTRPAFHSSRDGTNLLATRAVDSGEPVVPSLLNKRGQPSNKLPIVNHVDDNSETMLSNQRANRNLSCALNDGEEQDVRVLSGMTRSSRPVEAAGAGFLSSQATSVRATETIRQDQDVIAMKSRSKNVTHPKDSTQRGIGCPQRGVGGVEHRRSQPVRKFTSPRPSRPQEANEDRNGGRFSGLNVRQHERTSQQEKDPPSSTAGLPYRIPGPAGALQNVFRMEEHSIQDPDQNYGGLGRSCEKADALDFMGGPWLAANERLDTQFGKQRSRWAIVRIKSTYHRIPQLVAVIKTVIPGAFGDLSVTLQDETGTITGSIHRKVLTDFEDGPLIAPGAVIILQKVSVFSPSPGNFYLNITINNVDQIFSKDTRAPTSRGKVVNDNSTRSRERIHSLDVPDCEGNVHGFHSILGSFSIISQIQTAGKQGYQAESVAPGLDNGKRQKVTESGHTPDNSNHVNAAHSHHSSQELVKDANKSHLVEIMPEEAIGIEEDPVDGDVELLDTTGPPVANTLDEVVDLDLYVMDGDVDFPDAFTSPRVSTAAEVVGLEVNPKGRNAVELPEANCIPANRVLKVANPGINGSGGTDVDLLEASTPEVLSLKSEAEIKATQDALAKSAGWDMSEDVELLLGDDFAFQF